MSEKELGRIDLSGKVAVINGASRGIGEAIARGLAECGARVVLSSRKQDFPFSPTWSPDSKYIAHTDQTGNIHLYDVEKGSGKGVKTPGYRIAGKTGTAQKALNGIYLPGAKICSFVATLPVEDPRYVVLVVVDEPQGAHAYGSTVAVPVAKQIIDALLIVEKISPSKPAELNKAMTS